MQNFHASYLDRRHYQLLIAVRKHGSLSQAAQMLGLTQSAASHQIREAERRLGLELFEKLGRGVSLTEAAERLLEAGLHAEQTLRAAEFDAQRLNEASRPSLRIAIACFDHFDWLPLSASALADEGGGTSLEILKMPTANLTASVLEGTADGFFAPGLLPQSGLASLPFREDRLVACFPWHDAPETTGSVVPQLFRGRRYIASQREPAPDFEYERFFRPANIVPDDIQLVESISATVELIAAGLGASILPFCCVRGAIAARKVRHFELDPAPIKTRWALLHAASITGAKLKLMTRFAEVLKEAF